MGKKEDQHRWYLKNKPVHYEKMNDRRRALRKENGAKVEAHLRNNPCVDCQEGDVDVLQFDHVRGRKSGNVSKMVSEGLSWARIYREICKCEVRCANCHQRVTKRRRRAKETRKAQAVAFLQNASVAQLAEQSALNR